MSQQKVLFLTTYSSVSFRNDVGSIAISVNAYYPDMVKRSFFAFAKKLPLMIMPMFNA